MIRRPPRSTLDRSSAASDVYKRQEKNNTLKLDGIRPWALALQVSYPIFNSFGDYTNLSLIHISEPTRPY